MSTWEAVSVCCALLLMLIALLVLIILLSGGNAWLCICVYWAVLSLKNYADLQVVREEARHGSDDAKLP